MNNIFNTVLNNSIVAIDVEGDARSPEDNQIRFPDGIHYDPNTIVWCITFAFTDKFGNMNTHTYACKLPNVARKYSDGCDTRIYHEDNTIILDKVSVFNEFRNVQEISDRKEFNKEIFDTFKYIYSIGCSVIVKGYNKELNKKYGLLDKLELEDNYTRYCGELPFHLEFIGCFIPKSDWIATHKQGMEDYYIPNQTYINNGLQHNIQDTIQLYKWIDNQPKETINIEGNMIWTKKC